MANKTIVLSKELRIGNNDNFNEKIGTINPNGKNYIQSGINTNFICPNNVIKNSNGSWQYARGTSFSALCLPPTEELSRSIFKINAVPIGLSFGAFNPNYPVNNIYSSTYSADKLSYADLLILYDLISNDLITYNGKNGSESISSFFNDFKNKLCASRSNTPIFKEDPISKKPITYSSYFRSNTELGKLCLSWETTGDKTEVYDAKKVYCAGNPEGFECITMNPEKNNIYNSFSNPDKIPDQCWFTPFRTEFSDTKTFVYFFPEDKKDISKCPKNITVKFNPDNAFKVTDLEAKPYLSTTADGGGGGGGGGDGGDGGGGGGGTLSNTTICIIVAVVVILLISAILYFK